MTGHMTHSQLLAAALVELTRHGIMAWRAPTGVAARLSGPGLLRFGLPGQADILGILPPAGRLLACEIKTGTGRQSAQQRRYQVAVEAHGALYLVVRDLADLDPLWR